MIMIEVNKNGVSIIGKDKKIIKKFNKLKKIFYKEFKEIKKFYKGITSIKSFINKDFKRKQLYIKILDNYILQETDDYNETIYPQIKEYFNIH